MKITLFTSNQNRHNYFINLLSQNFDELFVVQENRTIFPGLVKGHYPVNSLVEKYFLNVTRAQKKIFGEPHITIINNNIHLLPLQAGDINNCSLDFLNKFLESDIYIVFGSSYIKGDLINFLIKKKTLNIHMGISPYYRGTDCNFWALYDENPHLVGATIHLLSKGLDSGNLLYHALSNINGNPFDYTMSTVKSAFHSISEKLQDETIFNIKPEIQNKSNEIRYSRKADFTENIVKLFFEKKINLNNEKFDEKLFKEPYILKKIDHFI